MICSNKNGFAIDGSSILNVSFTRAAGPDAGFAEDEIGQTRTLRLSIGNESRSVEFPEGAFKKLDSLSIEV